MAAGAIFARAVFGQKGDSAHFDRDPKKFLTIFKFCKLRVGCCIISHAQR